MAPTRRNRPYTKVLTPSGSDDKPALQAALNSAMSGWYKEIVVDGYLAMASGAVASGGNNGLILRGTSKWTSGLRAAAGAETAVLLTLGDGTTNYNGHETVRDLAFKSAVTKTGGAAISCNSGGESALIENCSILNTYDGIRMTGGASAVHVSGCDIYLYDSGMRDGIRIDYTGTAGYGSGTNIFDNEFCGQIGVVNSAAGINVLNGDALRIRNNSFVAFGTNLQIIPNENHTPENGYYLISDNIFSDCWGTANCVIDGTTYQIAKIHFTNNMFTYANILGSTAYGCVVKGQYARGVQFSNCSFGANASTGLLISSAAKDVSADNCLFNGNLGYGIDIASGVTGFRIVNCRMTNSNMGGGVAQTQTHGIRYGGSHSDAIVAMNDMRGNSTAATTGTAPSTNSTVTGNIS